LARTALADTLPSYGATFRLHDALLELLRAYLPPRVAKMWRDECEDFVFRKASARVGHVCVFITAGPMIKLCAGGEGDSEGHVL
jgi:hypothetical protein